MRYQIKIILLFLSISYIAELCHHGYHSYEENIAEYYIAHEYVERFCNDFMFLKFDVNREHCNNYNHVINRSPLIESVFDVLNDLHPCAASQRGHSHSGTHDRDCSSVLWKCLFLLFVFIILFKLFH